MLAWPASGPVVTAQLVTDLNAMVGVWQDHLEAFAPDGTALAHDEHGGAPGPMPYDNLVYIDFDGTNYHQSNVVLSGRDPHVRSFSATVSDGVLTFAKLGPDAPTHVGVSGGPGIIWFLARDIGEGWQHYSEPDIITLTGDRRTRHTALWRDGRLARTLAVTGVRRSIDPTVRVADDPRGPDGPVHDTPHATQVWEDT